MVALLTPSMICRMMIRLVGMRMADAWQVFDLPLPDGFVGCRHSFDGMSLRLLVQPSGKFRFDVLFRPRPAELKSLIKRAAPAPLPEYDLQS